MAIQENELRIGNYVNKITTSDNDADLTIVNALDIFNVSADLDFYEPIPLTEEWLLKFGFEKKKWVSELPNSIECFYFEKNGIIVYLLKYCFEIEIITKAGQFNTFKSWNYVHQLQNIFYCFCGTEITIQ